MFSAEQFFKFCPPMPPTPIPAIFSLLLGASGPPSTYRGTTENAEAAIAVFCKKARRVAGKLAGADPQLAGVFEFMIGRY